MTPLSLSHLHIKPPPLFFPFPPLCSGWGYSFPYWYYPDIPFLSRSFHAASSHLRRGVQNVPIMLEMDMHVTCTGLVLVFLLKTEQHSPECSRAIPSTDGGRESSLLICLHTPGAIIRHLCPKIGD
jgi:hypothetical protein